MNEVTLLQFYAQELGVSLDRTPKCHPEMAGEGIKYAWALAKLKYRSSPIIEKRSKEKFRKLVAKSTNPLDNLNIQRVQSCSRKARSYMKLYRVIQSVLLGEKQKFNNHILLENTMKIYVKLKKKSKSHRSVLDRQMADLIDIETHTFAYDHVIANVID